MSTARAFPPCVPSSPPSDIICDLWFAACASLSVCYIYDHARSAAIRAPCHRAPNIDTRCNRSFRQTLRPAVKIAKADIPRISTPSRVDLHQHPCAGAAAPMRRCCSTHATNPRRSKCRGQTRSSWMWATFQRTCHGQTFRLLSCSLFSSVCLRRSFVLTIMDLPGVCDIISRLRARCPCLGVTAGVGEEVRHWHASLEVHECMSRLVKT